MADTFICIYCKLVKPVNQRSKEHLLQRSLGGDLTAQFVCRDCNSGFSRIDQALSDRSTVTLSRVAYTPLTAQSVKAGGIATHYNKDFDVFIEVEIRNEMTAVVLPQLHLRATGQAQFIALDRPTAAQVVEFIAKQIRDGTLESIHQFHGLPNGTRTNSAALVVRKPGDGYIRLPSPDDALWYFPSLKKAWADGLAAELRKASPIPQEGTFPEVRLDFRFAPNDVYRAIAKTAFNVLAYKRGTDFVLRPEFDSIREYIKGQLVLPEQLEEGRLAVDTRFVAEIPENEQQISFVDDGHSVVFCYLAPELIGFVTLYGSHLFLVRFPAIDYEESEEFFGHRFSIDRSGNFPVNSREIFERVLQKHYDRLGLTMEQARKFLDALRPKDREAGVNGSKE